MKIVEPIILVGTQRSGTTWLGQAVSQASEIAYWNEPRHIWSWGHWFRRDDRLLDTDARPLIRRHIRRSFSRFVAHQDRERLCEKTPSNCLRLPFIRRIFPDARMVLILRDGRSVLRSTLEMMSTGPGWRRVGQRLKEVSPVDSLALLNRVPWLWAKMRGKKVAIWGPRPPGWRDWVKQLPPELVAAKQWSATIEAAVDDIERMPAGLVHTFRYEALVRRPDETMQQLTEFLALKDPEQVIRYVVDTVTPEPLGRWRSELDASLLEAVRPHVEPTMRRLGYSWDD